MVLASAAPYPPHLCASLLRKEPVINSCGVGTACNVRQGGVRQPQQVAPVAQAPPKESIKRLQGPVSMHASHREVAVLGQVDLLLQGSATRPGHCTGPGRPTPAGPCRQPLSRADAADKRAAQCWVLAVLRMSEG